MIKNENKWIVKLIFILKSYDKKTGCIYKLAI
jgi:hypothetical protein